MTNAQIADAFEMIGKILELKGENPFRVRAYARAAQTVAALTRGLADIYDAGGVKELQEIPGIGKDLSQKIEELLKTGKVAYLEELKTQVPTGLLDVMQVEGMGPKKTKKLWDEFGVMDIPSLATLAKSGKLAALKGWGETSAKNVLRGIESRTALNERQPIYKVWPMAEDIVRLLQETGLVERIEIAGSLRRRKETIGDIDILAVSKNVPALMQAFCSLPMVKHVLAQGETKSSVHLSIGVDADLRVVEDGVFGAALYYFTGSKEHNVHVRGIAVKRGITINEYGVYKGTKEQKGELLASRTEEDVFGVLDMQYVPPELREDAGEVEAAQKHELPTLITDTDIRGDLHMHSDFSDGSVTMEEMAKSAKAKGLEYIVFTDHASPMGMVKGIKEKTLSAYLKQIAAVRKKVPGIHILAGAEVDILEDGRLFLSDDALAALDWVVASVHGKMKQPREEMTARVIRAIENPHVRTIGHLTTRLLGQRPPSEVDFERVLAAAKKHDVSLELNASVYRLDINAVQCKRAKEVGVKIAINTDAHHPDELDYRFGVSQARRGWIEPSDVINTLPWPQFEQLLKGRKS